MPEEGLLLIGFCSLSAEILNSGSGNAGEKFEGVIVILSQAVRRAVTFLAFSINYIRGRDITTTAKRILPVSYADLLNPAKLKTPPFASLGRTLGASKNRFNFRIGLSSRFQEVAAITYVTAAVIGRARN